MNTINLDNPELYNNRELSWLEFNERVLEEAFDKTNPIIERFKFLAITSSNLDEFFMVRVSGLIDRKIAGSVSKDPAGLSVKQQLSAISARVHEMAQKQYNCLNRSLLPFLDGEKINILTYKELSKAQKTFVKDYYDTTVFPILTPMAIDQSRPFPLLANKSLNIIVETTEKNKNFALVQVPNVIPRLVKLPSEDGTTQIIMLEDIVKEYIKTLFVDFPISNAYCFRITRNSDFDIDEDDSHDLLEEIEESIKQRIWGEPVRLEVEKGINEKCYKFLKNQLNLDEEYIYKANGILDLTVFFALGGIVDRPELCDAPMPPLPVPEFVDKDMYEVIKQGDVLVHHPYQSFDCVVNFVKNSAVDPKVLAIKQTLYRVSGNSPIIKALIDAAENGKQVTVLVELKARFDEENNINWAKKLEKAGCHVIYGLVGLKTHCKLCLVVRQEEVGIVRYVHLGTGNYNDKTAKLYTDMGMFTCRESIASDVSSLFNVLTGYSKARSWNKIAVAPTDLRSMFLQRIERETENALAGKPSKITAKVNSLVDKDIIKALYRASQAGVKIDLIVRGICCLKPNIAGISDNINVISIVGRFLEHSRIYYFQNDDSPKIYLASADWMPRNLDRRVEVAFPVDNPDLKKRIVKILDITLNDTIKARVAQNDGIYRRKDKRGKELISSQMEFYKMEKKRNDSFFAESKKDVFIPNKGE